ncbi:MAG: TetR/AcrR family transcriptional regulator [Actinomycetota bacterium]|nr:TetR/AcrR family transcriptional regulator [Actinomycetota bacterium]
MKSSCEDEKKETIVKAANRLFGERGYCGTSIADIAKEAGLTPKLLYRYVDGKLELYAKACECAQREFEENLMGAISMDTGIERRARVEKGAKIFFQLIAGDKLFARILASSASLTGQEESTVEIRALENILQTLRLIMKTEKANIFEDEKNLEEFSWFLLALGSVFASFVLLGFDRRAGMDHELAIKHFLDAVDAACVESHRGD